MIIFREKLFRRDDFSDADFEVLKPDPEKVKEYGNLIIQMEPSDMYNKGISKLGIKGSQDRKRLENLKGDIKKFYISVDGPNGGDTHYLGDYSKPGEYYVFSKSITDIHRLNYRVYKPQVIIEGNIKKYVQRVVLISCYDHEMTEGNYLDDKDLRARKDRMRGNAPYRNKTSILSKKKHGNNRSNTKRT